MTRIKRILMFISLTFIICFSLFSSAQEEKPNKNSTIILRYAELRTKKHPLSLASNFFAKRVYERSNGRIDIKVYYDGTLGTSEDVLTQLQFGGIALGRVSLLELSELVKSIQYDFSSLILKDFSFTEKYLRDNSDNFNFALQCEKIFPLTVLPPSKRCIFSDEMELSNLENLKEMKIGISNSEMYRKVFKGYSENSIFMGNSDTYPSLRNGFIDVRETSLATFMQSEVYPFIKNVSIVDNVTVPSFIIASNDVMNQLSLQDRQLLISCAKEANEYEKTLLNRYESNALMQLFQDKNLRRLP